VWAKSGQTKQEGKPHHAKPQGHGEQGGCLISSSFEKKKRKLNKV
jgi:hypothetical protein